MDSLPDLSLGTAALIVFGICATYMLIKGLARTILNVTCLSISAWLAFRVWQLSPSLAMDWLGKNSDGFAIGLPVAAFLISFLILRSLIRFFLSAATPSSNDEEGGGKSSLVLRLLFTILPALALFLIAATFIHHAGSLSELKNFHQKTESKKSPVSLVEQLKASISSAIPQDLMAWLDPLASEPRLRLAKMITASADKNRAPEINPKTGKAYPRAIIVEDPELMDLARKGEFSELLRHPLLSEALKDPKIQKALQR